MNELQLKIYDIVKTSIEKEKILDFKIDTDLSMVGMDSITFVRCIVALEEVFGIEIPDEYLLMPVMNTIKKISDIVETVLATKGEKSE